jgi:hypothetical protein
MPWNEDNRRQPSRSKVNDEANVTKAPNVSGTGDEATARIASAFGSSDTQAGRDRLRLLDYRDDPEADRMLAAVEAGEDFDGTLSATQRIALGLHAEDKRKVADARRRLHGGDAA